MLRIEFTGCTSSGKSTLVREVYRQLASRGVAVATPSELVLGTKLSRWCRTDSLRSVVLGLALAPLGVGFCCIHPALSWFLFSHLLRSNASVGRKIARSGGLIGKMGTHAMLGIRRRGKGVVLIDEGMFQCAHNALAYAPGPVGSDVVDRFANAVPQSDHVVFVSAPAEFVVRRTMERPDPPIHYDAPSDLCAFVAKVLAMYEQLERHPRIADRALGVPCDGGAEALRGAADGLVQRLRIVSSNRAEQG